MRVLLFPGQGSQAPGMGAAAAARSAAAREAFEQADAILGLPLSALCFEGPAEALKPTELAQPALLVAGYATWLAVRETVGEFGLAAGHSLGEYTALVAAGALEFPTALRLVRRRGELMRDAGEARPGAMAAVLKLDDTVVEELCARVGGVGPANYNSPGQLVVSGEEAAVTALLAEVKAAGGRAMKLPVSGAFHSPLMADAAEAMAAELDAAEFADARVPVIQNVTAAPETQADVLRENLKRQVTGAVRWTESVRRMRELGATQVVELGPGMVLTGLVGRIEPGLAGYNVADEAGLDGLAKFLAEGAAS